MTATLAAKPRPDVTGIAFSVLLTIVIIFPLLVVCTWAFADVWRFPSVIPQQFGMRYWYATLARVDVWNALWMRIRL